MTICPDCGKRGVSLRLRPDGEDHLACRYCDWEAFVSPDTDYDRRKLARHEDAQILDDREPLALYVTAFFNRGLLWRDRTSVTAHVSYRGRLYKCKVYSNGHVGAPAVATRSGRSKSVAWGTELARKIKEAAEKAIKGWP